ncbi:MAG: histone deacetylase family protein [Candidatus Micrarchaeota archaeon]
MRIYYSPRFMEHKQPASTHPERPERLSAILAALERSGLRHELAEPRAAEEQDLLLAHSERHVRSVRALSEQEYREDTDTGFEKHTYDIARLAAGAAMDAAYNAMDTGEFSFALVRPPGHHAEREGFGGFCYFNNIAIALKNVLSMGIERAAVVDIDVHHGNGTQDIFLTDGRVFFLSLHQDPYTTYPGTGFAGESSQHILNVELPRGTGDEVYLQALSAALERVKAFAPKIVGISAGFDTFVRDPVAELGIEMSETYYRIGALINKIDCPKFACLEGGYHLPKLGENVVSFLRAFDRPGQ